MPTTFVDPYGRPLHIQQKLVRSAENNGTMPYQQPQDKDLDDLISNMDWRTILSLSRKLFMNMGIARGAALQKATYSVGRAWKPVFKGKDQKWGDDVATWLREEFYPICNVKGPSFNFRTTLFIDSISIDRDGEYFVLFTESKSGFPQIQRIGAHRVGQRFLKDDKVEKGPYKGAKIVNGIIKNKFGRAIAYRVLGEDESKDKDISARDMIHVFDPNWHSQGRGIPSGVHALDKLIRSLKSEEYEEMALLMLSSYGLIEYNEMGMPDPGDPRNILTQNSDDSSTQGITMKTMLGGMVKHFKAGSGSKLESLKHDRPGTTWENFYDRIARSYVTGMNWSYAYVWKSSDLNGPGQRVELEKCTRSVEDRQELLKQPTKKQITYGVAKAIKLGIIPPNKEWWKWDFTMPPRLTIDHGKDSKVQNESYKLGSMNMTEILAGKGRTTAEHFRERAEEIALMKTIKAEVEEKYSITIEDREMRMLTPNETAKETEEDENEEEKKEDKEK